MENNKKIIYLAELDADIDDVIAAKYLHLMGFLRCVVLDPYPKTPVGIERYNDLKAAGVEVLADLPEDSEIVFIGGAFTKIAAHIKSFKIGTLIGNGGFVGYNIMKNPLEKFKGKKEIRTFNFNCDVKSTDAVLKSDNIGKIILVGKNVCHNYKNTLSGIWKDFEFLKEFKLKPEKRLHDLLACREGLVICSLLEEDSFLNYMDLKPYNTGIYGNSTLWGSCHIDNPKTPYRAIQAAVEWKQ